MRCSMQLLFEDVSKRSRFNQGRAGETQKQFTGCSHAFSRKFPRPGLTFAQTPGALQGTTCSSRHRRPTSPRRMGGWALRRGAYLGFVRDEAVGSYDAEDLMRSSLVPGARLCAEVVSTWCQCEAVVFVKLRRLPRLKQRTGVSAAVRLTAAQSRSQAQGEV
ncbi:hypothetical protein BDV95DRAFT_306389 [Massariosphaeria phaeospora]|uniref:Uncharacterized protein n=1 Tax=Massariosphaeria phaeospora TaxID=100035 RepID=A0A7C8MDJ0_9PLEO|nr:hypothetical protein BDV95DRAFT_306389 [Massariosphaeria phaeospora]